MRHIIDVSLGFTHLRHIKQLLKMCIYNLLLNCGLHKLQGVFKWLILEWKFYELR